VASTAEHLILRTQRYSRRADGGRLSLYISNLSMLVVSSSKPFSLSSRKNYLLCLLNCQFFVILFDCEEGAKKVLRGGFDPAPPSSNCENFALPVRLAKQN
jgi:hypothetical protein